MIFSKFLNSHIINNYCYFKTIKRGFYVILWRHPISHLSSKSILKLKKMYFKDKDSRILIRCLIYTKYCKHIEINPFKFFKKNFFFCLNSIII